MKINYDLIMQEELEKIKTDSKTLLLHSCCAPCSTAVIERLKEYFNITIYYYNPNIEPFKEYEKRKKEQIKLLKILNIPYFDCEYENEKFQQIITGLEKELEGGKRCINCFELRLKKTALTAIEENFDYFGTTLTVSPHKNSQIVNEIGLKLARNLKIKFLPADFKKNAGYQRSIQLANKYKLYRQNYCGCNFSKNI